MKKPLENKLKKQNGSMMLIVLIFSSIAVLILGSLIILIQVQRTASLKEASSLNALSIAEAGVNYYRWHLAHTPDEFTQDTGIHDYNDPYGGQIGQFDLTVTAPSEGSDNVTIRSTGWTTAHPNIQRTIEVSYGIQSLAQYAFLSNSNVWFGDKEELKGPMHSNGGIRMDGQSNSTLTSAKETYICGPEHNCDNETKPGIWGSGTNDKFWNFPVAAVDFDAIILDLATMKQDASDDGIFLASSGSYGYLVTFSQTGTFSINKVTSVYSPEQGYNGTEWVYEANSYKNSDPIAGLQNIAIPNNGIIYLEDKVWVEGKIHGRATVVAAKTIEQGSNASIIIQNNMEYHDNNSDRLALIAQQDILVPLRSPDFMKIDGALLAQKGHVFRYYYPQYNSQPYKTYALRKKIQTYGTIITNTIWTWSWVSSDDGPVISGYEQTQTSYDTDLLFDPPPSFPSQGNYEFISWDERMPGE